MQIFNIPLNHRAVLVRDGRAVSALAPGRHVTWRRHEVVRWPTDKPVFEAPQAVLAALPHDWYETVHVATGHYGIVARDARAVAFLNRAFTGCGRSTATSRSACSPTPIRCRSSPRSCAR